MSERSLKNTPLKLKLLHPGEHTSAVSVVSILYLEFFTTLETLSSMFSSTFKNQY